MTVQSNQAIYTLVYSTLAINASTMCLRKHSYIHMSQPYTWIYYKTSKIIQTSTSYMFNRNIFNFKSSFCYILFRRVIAMEIANSKKCKY